MTNVPGSEYINANKLGTAVSKGDTHAPSTFDCPNYVRKVFIEQVMNEPQREEMNSECTFASYVSFIRES